MSIQLINPKNGLPLETHEDQLRDAEGNAFPIVAGIPRIAEVDNYTENFGKQWNAYRTTQIDRPEEGLTHSETRFFRVTNWIPEELDDHDVLEVGSGAGRFTRVLLQRTQANLYSVDYSNAVEANLENNTDIAAGRLHLFQASIYELPFPDDSFDKVFCMGVLQHTPDFEASIHSLVRKAKRGGEIVVDFYPIRGFWTKIHAKYLLRPLTKRMPHERLHSLIERHIDRLIGASSFLNRIGLGALTRFVPLVDIRGWETRLPKDELREWALLDTFDMFSPEYDNPQRINAVVRMMERAGATISFAGWIDAGSGSADSAVVRARKK